MFSQFYDNDGDTSKVAAIQGAILSIPVGATRVVFGWPVTRWTKDSFEVGTWGKDTVCSETAAEGIASSTNAT